MITAEPDMSWLPHAFDLGTIFMTTTTIVCCAPDDVPGFHAAAIALAHKNRLVIVDVDVGEDPREAVYKKIGRDRTVADAVKNHLEKTKRDLFIIIRDADRFAVGEDNLTALWALKSARDQFHPRVRILFFGSDRAALQSLVSSKSAPFLGTKVLP
ncbi:MAG: hypothetical protein ACK5X0_08435 [Rhodospirillales bacterium]|jgi:hypothetical protein